MTRLKLSYLEQTLWTIKVKRYNYKGITLKGTINQHVLQPVAKMCNIHVFYDVFVLCLFIMFFKNDVIHKIVLNYKDKE